MASNVHDNSIQTFYETEQDREKRRAEVFEVYVKAGRSMTDREVCKALGYNDLNAVRPRCSELVDEGLLIEVGKTRCPITNRRVRLMRVREREAQMAFA